MGKIGMVKPAGSTPVLFFLMVLNGKSRRHIAIFFRRLIQLFSGTFGNFSVSW